MAPSALRSIANPTAGETGGGGSATSSTGASQSAQSSSRSASTSTSSSATTTSVASSSSSGMLGMCPDEDHVVRFRNQSGDISQACKRVDAIDPRSTPGKT